MPALMGGTPSKKAEEPKIDEDAPIDPDIRELGDYFNIEERWIKRLNETMLKRKETKKEDIEKLYEVLERARSPTGLLTVQIGKMECGQFVGKIKPDKDVERLARKFKLDDHVTSRLTELKVCRRTSGQEERGIKDLERLEQHLRYCKRPNAMATLLAGKLLEGEVDELPDLSEAEKIMEKYKLDEDARSKLREIVEKRANDVDEVLAVVKRHLDTSSFASSMLCKIARTLIDGDMLPDPPERAFRKGGGKGKDGDDEEGKGRGRDRGDRDRGGGDRGGGDRGGDRGGGDRGDRDRDRERGRDRSRSRDRGRDRRDSRERR